MNFSFSGFFAKILNWLRPSPGNDAPEIILPQLDGHVNEGDSTEALSAGGQVRFLDRDLHDSHVAQAEFISTSNPAGVEYGAFEAVVTRAPLLLRSGVVDWEFVVNDADIQFLA